jgi:hypothetical protein
MAADEFVNAPWKYTVEVPDGLNSTPLENRDAKVIYDATGLLLILGEFGSGKTTTSLDLARTLLERAGKDIKERVPVVLNLSNWKKKQPLSANRPCPSRLDVCADWLHCEYRPAVSWRRPRFYPRRRRGRSEA